MPRKKPSHLNLTFLFNRWPVAGAKIGLPASGPHAVLPNLQASPVGRYAAGARILLPNSGPLPELQAQPGL